MRAIACRIGAESDTPAAAALARKSASSAGHKTGGGRDRAAISHQDAPPRGKGCKPPARDLRRRAGLQGIEGGWSHPSPAPMLHIG